MFANRKKQPIYNIFQSKSIYQKIADQHKTITIGVFGTQVGSGVTHTCLALGRYFGTNRLKVAFLEWGPQAALSDYIKCYEGQNINLKEIRRPTPIKKVDYYIQGNDGDYMSIKQKNYKVILIDFGCIKEKNHRMINQCDMKILVGRSNDWNYGHIFKTVDRHKSISDDWKVLIPYCSKVEKRHISNKLKNRVFTLGFNSDPFELNKENKENIESILNT